MFIIVPTVTVAQSLPSLTAGISHLGASIVVCEALTVRSAASDGTTFSTFLLDYRVACAYRMFCRPQYRHWDIGKIAGYVRFGDLSYFGRCFRKIHGSTPRDIRRAEANSKPLNCSCGDLFGHAMMLFRPVRTPANSIPIPPHFFGM